MNKYILTYAVTVLLFSPVTTNGQFTYTTNADNTLTITGYTGPGGAVTIPTNIAGLLVTGIGDFALAGNEFVPNNSLVSVTVPGTVTSIGFFAFGDCPSLTSTTLTNGLTSIGSEAFYGCDSLTNITIPSTVTNIGEYAFQGCRGPGRVTIPFAMTSIGDYVFYGCGINNLIVPAGVTNIGRMAFAYCESLSNASMAGVTSIGTNAFYCCTNLTTVNLSGGVIGCGAFQFCSGSSGPLGEILVSGLSNVSLGDGVASIENYAFEGDPTLQSIVIPGGVTNIGLLAFDGCFLTNVTLSDGLISIGESAFQQCPLNSLIIPSSVTYIGPSAFYTCGNLTNLVIPASVTQIGAQAFGYDEYLTNVFFLGNAPVQVADQSGAFAAYPIATLYYLPGTTGWTAQFSNATNVLWNPIIQTNDGHFGVRSNQFGFNITGTTNIPIVVEACTNLANPVWTPLTNVSLTNGSFYFSDPQWTNYPGRFYGIGFP